MLAAFIVFMLLFAAVGASAVWRSRGDKHDYYLAGGSVPAWLVGLSAVATNNSGYMFIGVIGYTYATGLGAVWLMLGWICGDYLASIYVHARLRRATARTGAVSYAGVLAGWYGDKAPRLQRLIGLLSLVFLLTYASAQLLAGSKALHVLFDWPLWAGAALGATLVLIYCVSGGIRASIWTDAAQSVVMIGAMALLLVAGLAAAGGLGGATAQLRAVPGYLDWFPEGLAAPGAAGALLFAGSWLAAGALTVGQPHIMVRFMTLRDPQQMNRARAYYYFWFTGFYLLCTAVGLLARIFLPDLDAIDPELALPTMAAQLLAPALVGVIIAGIFAATMSTADSLVLSCSAAITHDLMPSALERPLLLKLTTAILTLVALLLALNGPQSVFAMVILAWSGLGAAFGPLLISRCLGWRVAEGVALAAVTGGFVTVLIWRWQGLHAGVYEGLPGLVVGLSILAAGHFALQRRASTAAAKAAA